MPFISSADSVDVLQNATMSRMFCVRARIANEKVK